MARRGADAFTDQLEDSHCHTANSRVPGGDNDMSPVPLDPSLAPLLLFDRGGGQSDDDDDTIFLYSIPKRKLLSRSRRAAGLAGHRYWVTPQGWLLMLHLESRDTFLWNPSSFKRIHLHVDQDNLLDGIGDGRCLLSRRPSDADADCVVLLLDRDNSVFYYCRPVPGGSRWLRHAHGHHSLMDNCLATAGEKFCSYNANGIVTLEFSPNPTFTTHDLLEHSSRIIKPTGYTMWCDLVVESNGELFSLIFCHPVLSERRVTQIVVRKLDLSTGAWLRADTLGGAVFLVDCTRRYGASFDARRVAGLGKGNRIYFLTYEDKALYVYDLERGTTAMHDPGLDLHDSHVEEYKI
ncbi:hypothetical protein VPH35_124673 [Triticum aestivum]